MNLAQKVAGIKDSLELRRLSIEESKNNQALLAELNEQKKLLESLIESVQSVDNSIASKEYPEAPRVMEISNLPEQKEFPESFSIKQPNWLKQFSLSELTSALSALLSRRLRVDLDEYRTAKKAISVRLSDGQTFINQLAQAVSMAGGGSDVVEISNLPESIEVNNFPDIGINLPEWDSVVATYPSDPVEVYTFSLDSVEVATVTVTYTDETKEVFTSAVVSKP